MSDQSKTPKTGLHTLNLDTLRLALIAVYKLIDLDEEMTDDERDGWAEEALILENHIMERFQDGDAILEDLW